MGFSNFDPHEGVLSGSLTVVFNIKVKRVVLTNDSHAPYRFRAANHGRWATLLPNESIKLDLQVKSISLVGHGDYRVWGLG